MNSEENQLLVSDGYEACVTNILQNRILHQHGHGEISLPVKEKCPCSRFPKKQQKLLYLSLLWAIPYNYIFHIKCL